ncbi:MAG TPA: aldehyde ferredoxin oxidoreductase C-terminal domain-containing protein [Anaerolineales bacterium]|nr:aldehyde ferredoxin oxidoreductase C-terminal domain-containing protein [Anaerolineales bacterium]
MESSSLSKNWQMACKPTFGWYAYYALAGWSPSGVPTAETLAELGLGGVL